MIGVLALQGAFAAHQTSLHSLGVSTVRVREPADLLDLDGIVLPGGESTTMSNLLRSTHLDTALARALKEGLPALGTCAGLILLADRIMDGRDDQICFHAIDLVVRRNGYGRQVDSFETDITIDDGDIPFHAVFIRAPIIESVGPEVRVLATHDGVPCLVRQGHVMACSFHPELTGDLSVHRLFVDLVRQGRENCPPSTVDAAQR